MPLTPVGGRSIMLMDRPSGRPSIFCYHSLTSVSYNAISLCLVEGLQWNLPQIFVTQALSVHCWEGFPG